MNKYITEPFVMGFREGLAIGGALCITIIIALMHLAPVIMLVFLYHVPVWWQVVALEVSALNFAFNTWDYAWKVCIPYIRDTIRY